MAEYIIIEETNVVTVVNRDNDEILYSVSKTSVANPSRGQFEKVVFSDQNADDQYYLTLTNNDVYTQDFGGAEVLFTGTLDELVFKLNDEYFESPSSGSGGGGGGSTQPSGATNTSTNPLITPTTMGANTSRKFIEFYNDTDVDIYVLVGSGIASATNFTTKLKTDGYYSTENTTTIHYVAASTATGLLHITDNV